MEKFDIVTFKKNIKFFILVPIIIIVSLIISFFVPKEEVVKLKEKTLPEKGESSVEKLVINEVQSSNGGIISDKGKLYDWVELYNGTDEDKNLTNYTMSDTGNKLKWTFPNNTVIKAKSYLIIYLTGLKEEGLHTNFKLSSEGNEYLVLRKANKKIVDAVDTVNLKKGQVLARDLLGSFVIYNEATPGYVNTKEGQTSYLESLKSKDKDLIVINEILPNNKGYFKDSFGLYNDYIEIKNTGNKAINLKTYSLSDTKNRPFRYNLPDYNLKPNEVFVFFASGKNKIENKEYHTDFKLNSLTGTIMLSNNGKIVESVDYNVSNGLAYIRGINGFYESNNISFGFNNDTAGVKSYQSKYLKVDSNLIISEVMNSNYKYLPINKKYYDFIEIYNKSDKDINLKDYSISKNKGETSYKLPNIIIKSKSYYVLFASGNEALSNDKYKHLGFKIGNNDGIYLLKENKIIDSIFVSNIPNGYSIGKDLSGKVGYYSKPTPNKENSSLILEIPYKPTTSVKSGIYNKIKLNVVLSGEGNIYYTTNGTTPTTKSLRYTKPLVISKTTVIKAISVLNGKSSPVTTSSYIVNEKHTIDVMSVSLNPGDFSRIQANPSASDYEFPAYAEFFNKDGTTEGFSIPCGMKLFGGSTRWHSQKSFSINFRKKYGAGSLEYKVFDNRDFTKYESLVLRTASQDAERAYIRDIVGTSLVDGVTNIEVQAYRPIILYINGNYWGVYFIREKVTDSFVKSHSSSTSATASDIVRIDGDVKSGSKKSYNELLSYIRSHNLANNKYYDYVATKINIDSIIDFWVAEAYITNNDIVNCRFYRNPDIDDGKWHFVFYDLDFAFYNYSLNYYQFETSSRGMTVNGYSTELLRNLMKNKKFKTRYVERVSYQLKEVWNQKRVNAKIDEIVKLLEPEMPRNFSRWKYNSMSNWYSAITKFKKYVSLRQKYMLSQTKSFFGLSNSDYKKYFGGL